MTAYNQSSVLFVSLSVPTGKENGTIIREEVRFHTGVGSLFSKSHFDHHPGRGQGYWYSYAGVGGLLSISSATNASTTTSNEFTIQLAIPKEMAREQASIDLLTAAARTPLEDEDLCVFVLDYDGQRPLGPLEVPELLFIARVSNISIDASRISLTCYTAASQLDKVHQHPTVWNDFQQKVNKGRTEDWGFRFTNLTGEEAELNFP